MVDLKPPQMSMVILTSCLLGSAYPGSRFRSQNMKDENVLEQD